MPITFQKVHAICSAISYNNILYLLEDRVFFLFSLKENYSFKTMLTKTSDKLHFEKTKFSHGKTVALRYLLNYVNVPHYQV